MSKVNIFTLLTLAIVTAVTANSCAVKDYKEKLLPACDLEDIQIKWPNYEDQTSYYRCVNVNSARLLSCPSGKVFVYVYQECRSCEDYIPAVECRNLRTQNTPICLPIDGGNNSGNGGGNGGNGGGNNVVTYPTPRYPEQTTIPDVNTTSTSESSEQPDDNSSTVEVSSTQPTPAASSSPSTESTDIPQPSSPPPTPESVSQEPSESTSSVEVPTKEPSAPPSPDDVTTTPFPTPPSIE